jgi:hypothetical protein
MVKGIIEQNDEMGQLEQLFFLGSSQGYRLYSSLRKENYLIRYMRRLIRASSYQDFFYLLLRSHNSTHTYAD